MALRESIPAPEQMTTVFISYARADQPFAMRLVKDLRSRSFDVWVDEAKVGIGETLEPMISAAISEAEYFLILMSWSSLESAWVRSECETALSVRRKSNHPVIIPIRLDDSPLFPMLDGRVYIDFRERTSYSSTLKRLTEFMGYTGDVLPHQPYATGVRVNETDDKLLIVRNWRSSHLFVPQFREGALIFLSICLTYRFLVGWEQTPTYWHFAGWVIIGLLSILLLKNVWFTVACLINRQLIELTPSHLKVSHGPLPLVAYERIEVPATSIRAVELETHQLYLSRHTITYYVLSLRLIDGKALEIPSGTLIYDQPQAIIIRNRIVAHLGIGDRFSRPIEDSEKPREDLTTPKRRAVSDPRLSVFLGNAIALRKWRLSVAIAILIAVGINLHAAFVVGRRPYTWIIAGIVKGLTAIGLIVNRFQVYRTIMLALVVCAIGGGVVAWALEGWGRISLILLSGLFGHFLLNIYSTVPRRLFLPVAVQDVEAEKVSDHKVSTGIDISASRVVDGKRQVQLFTRSDELFEALIAWRKNGHSKDVMLRWGKTLGPTVESIREQIWRTIGLRFLTEHERRLRCGMHG